MDKYETKEWNKKDYWNLIVMFFYLFFFRLYKIKILSILESTIIIGVVLFIYLFLSPNYRKNLEFLLSRKKYTKPVTGFLIVILIALIISLVHGISDLSIMQVLLHQMAFLVVSIMTFSYFRYRGCANKVIEYIIIAYSIQTIVQYFSFVLPAFNSFTDLFKSEEAIILKRQYDGFRLNAISGSLAGSLAFAYSVVTIILISRWRTVSFRGKYTKYIALVLLILGGVAAGRISIILNIIGIVFFSLTGIFNSRKKLSISYVTLRIILLIPFLLIGIVYVINYVENNASMAFMARVNTVTNWLANTRTHYSPNTSNNFWEFSYSALGRIDVLFGDGIFTNPDGTYYLGVDAGYVRMLAYGGIFWLVTLVSYQLSLFNKTRYRMESIALTILVFIATAKQDCMAISLQSQLVFFMLYFCNVSDEDIITQEGINAIL